MTNQKEQGTTRQVMTSQDPTQYEKIYQMTLKIFYKIQTPIPSNQLSQSVTLFCKKIPLDTHHYSPTTKTRKLKKKRKKRKAKNKENRRARIQHQTLTSIRQFEIKNRSWRQRVGNEILRVLCG